MSREPASVSVSSLLDHVCYEGKIVKIVVIFKTMLVVILKRACQLYCFYIANIIVDVIHRPVFSLEHNMSETGLCLCLKVVLDQLDSI
jgi:hypothetical protein